MLRTLFLALFLSVPLAAAQVQVTLTDGQVIEGELLKEDPESITVQQQISGRKGGMKATMTYPRSRVSKVEPIVDAATRYTELAAKTADTAGAQLGLAEWCRDHDLRSQAVERAQRVLALDAESSKAKDLLNTLGLFELDGAWLNEADYCAKSGKVRYKNQFLTPAEAEIAKAKDAAASEAKTKQDAADLAENRSEHFTKDIAAVEKQIKAIEESKVAATKEKSQAEATQARYAALQRDLDSAQNKLNAEKQKGPTASPESINEYNNAQARLDKERPAFKDSTRLANTATDRLASLERQLAALNEKRKKLNEEKTKADQAAAEKKTAADQAATEAKAAADAKPAIPAAPATPATPAP